MLCEICRTHLNTWVKDYHFAELIELIEEYTYDDVIFFNIIPFHKKKIVFDLRRFIMESLRWRRIMWWSNMEKIIRRGVRITTKELKCIKKTS